MLAGGLDAGYRRVLAASHESWVQVDVYRAGAPLAEDIPILGGQVTANLGGRVARNASISVHEDLIPDLGDVGGLLMPYGNELRISAGVRYGDGNRVGWPIFRGKITDTSVADGIGEVDASDRAQEVVNAGFLNPTTSNVGQPVATQVRELISNGVPDAEFGPFDAFALPVPLLTWETDRAAALDELATSVGALWYPLSDGRFVLRATPWATPGAPVVELRDGNDGVILTAAGSASSRGVYNSVTAIGERTDGTPPAWAIAQDTDPGSPTYVGGPFGLRHKLLRLQTPASQPAALGAGRKWLRQATALVEQWSWAQLPDAAVELGDHVRLVVRGRTVDQVITGFTFPLQTSGQMRVTGRAVIAGDDD